MQMQHEKSTLENRQFVTQLNMQLPYEPTIGVFNIYLREIIIYVHTVMCTVISIANLFMIVSN